MKWTGFRRALTRLAAGVATLRTRIGHSEKLDDRQRRDRERLTAQAMQAYLLYVLMPLWTIPGFGDYLCHRRAKIELTSGTQESITHSLMMASVAVPALQALLFETNALTLVVAAGASIFHELVVVWDVAYAAPRRHVSVTEQHLHSFLEVLPFATLSSYFVCVPTKHWRSWASPMKSRTLPCVSKQSPRPALTSPDCSH